MQPRLRALAACLALPLLVALPAASLAPEAALPGCLEHRAMPEGALSAMPRDHSFTFESCIGAIRPGALMTSPSGCTFNFVFRDSASALYIGTAGHCTSSVGQRVSAEGVGGFGTVVYRRFSGVNDFTLIKIDADKHSRVNPTLCAWGGPIGAADPGSSLPKDVFLEYGWGFVTLFAPHTRARAHVEAQAYPAHITWTGVGSGGDSGAPVVNQAGYAVGIHTFGQTPFAGVVLEGGPSMANVLSMGRTAVPTLELVTGDPTSVEVALRGLTY